MADYCRVSVRREAVGGGVADRAMVLEGPAVPRQSRLILLIHGFNNSQQQATDAYEAFLALAPALRPQTVAFYWPGDNPALKGASYMFEFGKARTSAALLRAFLQAQVAPSGGPLRVEIVCHSLGNRVGLEALLAPLSTPHLAIVVSRMCLMAAAVPTSMVEAGERLRPAVDRVQNTRVMFSEADAVLHHAFPLGQTLIGEGFFPRAVGRFGEPTVGVWGSRANMAGFGHGSYWKEKRGADTVAGYLGQGLVPRYTESSVIAARELAVRADIERREIPGRRLLSRRIG